MRHRLAGRGNDDSYAWSLCAERLIVAVADGVGSLPDAARAADVACRAAVGAGVATPEEAVADANRALYGAGFASDGDGPPSGAATLVVAAVEADGSYRLARVGDSSAWLVPAPAAGGSGTELFMLPDPERAGNATEAIPAPAPGVETVAGRLAGGEILCLVTDGVADPWRDGPTTVAPALEEALAGRPGPLELLRLADFSRQGCHDDRTLLAVWLTDS